MVVDASAALSALLNGPARRTLIGERLRTLHLVDSEVASGLRRRVVARQLTVSDGWTALGHWRRLGVARYPASALLDRVWERRHNLPAYDATYVALAELLDCDLLTANARLSHARGVRCRITVVP